MTASMTAPSTSTSTTANPQRRFLRYLATGVAILALTAACSDKAEDMTDAELRTALQEVLTDSAGTITAEQASCIVDGLFEKAPRDQINRMANAKDDGDFESEDEELLVDVAISCI